MRTPGNDRELAAGFLLSEGIVHSADDIGTIRHCLDAEPDASGNVIDVSLLGAAADRASAALGQRRLVAATSACGVCGRRSIDDLMRERAIVDARWSIPASVVASLPARLRAAQPAFDETGGLHAAGLFRADGTLIGIAEDVGRHNAVDKVIGAELLRERIPLAGCVLCVSGRTSFEIVQKAVAGGIPIVAAVSAPSSLAIELARAANLTLLGFVRGESFNIYSVPERIC
jgi:FdhD protein